MAKNNTNEQQNPKDNHTPGFKCPKCNFFVEMSIHGLLYDSSHSCPGCHTSFSMNRGASVDALHLLQKLHVAMKNLDSVKEFKL